MHVKFLIPDWIWLDMISPDDLSAISVNTCFSRNTTSNTISMLIWCILYNIITFLLQQLHWDSIKNHLSKSLFLCSLFQDLDICSLYFKLHFMVLIPFSHCASITTVHVDLAQAGAKLKNLCWRWSDWRVSRTGISDCWHGMGRKITVACCCDNIAPGIWHNCKA